MPYLDELALLKGAVADAGAKAMEYFRADPKVWEKEGHGPVTEADYAANEILEKTLLRACPDFGWLSEETTDDASRLDKSHIWIVDPIDGTRAFVQGKPEFTICAALAVDGEIVAGCAFNPASNEHFSAALGEGATLNGSPIKAQEPAGSEVPRAIMNNKFGRAEFWPGGAPEFKKTYVSSLAYRVCLVAAGKFHTTLSANRFSEWDMAAGQIILSEAGGTLTGWEGEKLLYNNPETRLPGLIGAAPAFHQRLLNARLNLS